jgi:hypothetical protein
MLVSWVAGAMPPAVVAGVVVAAVVGLPVGVVAAGAPVPTPFGIEADVPALGGVLVLVAGAAAAGVVVVGGLVVWAKAEGANAGAATAPPSRRATANLVKRTGGIPSLGETAAAETRHGKADGEQCYRNHSALTVQWLY